MTTRFQAIRGMHDILPPQIQWWQQVEAVIRQIMHSYNYQEIRLPIVETTELFQHSIGEVTDIVEKEMYSFVDRNGDSLTLRPEGTAGCVRAVIENSLLDSPRRLWYQGPMFRHERPQKGRYRQFHQFGVEIFGLPGPDIDLELIVLTARLWRTLGLQDVELQLNTLGTPNERNLYRTALVTYLRDHYSTLDEDSRRRLERNPLRILDTKNPNLQQIVANAPTLLEYLDTASQAHFTSLKTGLTACGVNFVINPRLVRGLDYYARTVFEWVSAKLGAQSTVCAGGRYDDLVTQLGGPTATPAIGCAIGMERLVTLLAEQAGDETGNVKLDVFVINIGETAYNRATILAEQARDAVPQCKIQVHCGGGSFKSQFKKADRSGASYALVLGDGEIAREVIGIKPLRIDTAQYEIPWTNFINWLQDHYRSKLL